MRKLILSLAVAIFALSANAQDGQPTRISIAANIGAPTTTGYKIAYGVDLQADFPVASALAITASAGYQNFHWKAGGINGNNGFIPLLGGAKFNFGESKAYGHAQLGYGVSTAKGGTGGLAYAPSIGYNFNPNFDASLKYLAFSRSGSTIGSVNLRLAYNF